MDSSNNVSINDITSSLPVYSKQPTLSGADGVIGKQKFQLGISSHDRIKAQTQDYQTGKCVFNCIFRKQ
ncbi:hypothetical protein QFZ37_003573 [Chryseobacterium ginsenosidimutans]|uniref:hypothetical protein n=1 Tax=Chryseobacterium ginsenosidimutans TaxID=687846 RepID=UPI002780C526|nr:hypothetical protein [Chryseobacterium ginsenosidimutans]MDQ0595204.1 hypothetical protein [Chryseobacterium ginsenosidimutans]